MEKKVFKWYFWFVAQLLLIDTASAWRAPEEWSLTERVSQHLGAPQLSYFLFSSPDALVEMTKATT